MTAEVRAAGTYATYQGRTYRVVDIGVVRVQLQAIDSDLQVSAYRRDLERLARIKQNCRWQGEPFAIVDVAVDGNAWLRYRGKNIAEVGQWSGVAKGDYLLEARVPVAELTDVQEESDEIDRYNDPERSAYYAGRLDRERERKLLADLRATVEELRKSSGSYCEDGLLRYFEPALSDLEAVINEDRPPDERAAALRRIKNPFGGGMGSPINDCTFSVTVKKLLDRIERNYRIYD